MTRFCPLCGKPDSDVEFFGELCTDCARERVAPLAPVSVRLCQKCGSLLDKAGKKKEASLEQELTRLLKLKGANPVFSGGHSSVEYDTPYGRMSQPLTVLYEKFMCSDCGRAGSQYFEAIIQLRGDGKRVGKMATALIRRIQSRSFIPRIEELREGIDIYCGSRSEAIAALNSQELGFLRTEKLAGQRDGKRLYRTTLLVRL